MPRLTFIVLCALGALCLLAPIVGADTTVTYQGRFDAGGQPYNGNLLVEFRVFDAEVGGNQIGLPTVSPVVPVVDGVFTTEFVYSRDGTAESPRFLEVKVLPEGEASFLTLSPRSPIRPAPEAGQTRAARLQPNGDVYVNELPPGASVLATNGTQFGIPGDAQYTSVVQTFVSDRTGSAIELVGSFNRKPRDLVNFDVVIQLADAPFDVVATGSALNVPSTISSIPLSPIDQLQAGIAYRVTINSYDAATSAPTTTSTGITNADPIPTGELNANAALDATIDIVLDPPGAGFIVFDDGLSFATNGLLVEPVLTGGDLSVRLPAGSVNATETAAEPGISVGTTGANGQPEATATLIAPADGFVHAIGTVDVVPGVETSTVFPATASLIVDGVGSLDATVVSTEGTNRVTLQGVLAVTAGQVVSAHIPEVIGPFGGNGFNGKLVLIFYPTSYAP